MGLPHYATIKANQDGAGVKGELVFSKGIMISHCPN
jgi:hypothetical protein